MLDYYRFPCLQGISQFKPTSVRTLVAYLAKLESMLCDRVIWTTEFHRYELERAEKWVSNATWLEAISDEDRKAFAEKVAAITRLVDVLAFNHQENKHYLEYFLRQRWEYDKLLFRLGYSPFKSHNQAVCYYLEAIRDYFPLLSPTHGRRVELLIEYALKMDPSRLQVVKLEEIKAEVDDANEKKRDEWLRLLNILVGTRHAKAEGNFLKCLEILSQVSDKRESDSLWQEVKMGFRPLSMQYSSKNFPTSEKVAFSHLAIDIAREKVRKSQEYFGIDEWLSISWQNECELRKLGEGTAPLLGEKEFELQMHKSAKLDHRLTPTELASLRVTISRLPDSSRKYEELLWLREFSQMHRTFEEFDGYNKLLVELNSVILMDEVQLARNSLYHFEILREKLLDEEWSISHISLLEAQRQLRPLREQRNSNVRADEAVEFSLLSISLLKKILRQKDFYTDEIEGWLSLMWRHEMELRKFDAGLEGNPERNGFALHVLKKLLPFGRLAQKVDWLLQTIQKISNKNGRLTELYRLHARIATDLCEFEKESARIALAEIVNASILLEKMRMAIDEKKYADGISVWLANEDWSFDFKKLNERDLLHSVKPLSKQISHEECNRLSNLILVEYSQLSIQVIMKVIAKNVDEKNLDRWCFVAWTNELELRRLDAGTQPDKTEAEFLLSLFKQSIPRETCSLVKFKFFSKIISQLPCEETRLEELRWLQGQIRGHHCKTGKNCRAAEAFIEVNEQICQLDLTEKWIGHTNVRRSIFI